MADQQPSEGAEPSNGPFDDPPMAIGPQAAAILVATMHIVGTVRAGEHDAARCEAFAQRIAVVSAVAEQMFRIAAVRGDARPQRGVNERDFRGRRRGDGDSQRNTLTLDQYHAL